MFLSLLFITMLASTIKAINNTISLNLFLSASNKMEAKTLHDNLKGIHYV